MPLSGPGASRREREGRWYWRPVSTRSGRLHPAIPQAVFPPQRNRGASAAHRTSFWYYGWSASSKQDHTPRWCDWARAATLRLRSGQVLAPIPAWFRHWWRLIRPRLGRADPLWAWVWPCAPTGAGHAAAKVRTPKTSADALVWRAA